MKMFLLHGGEIKQAAYDVNGNVVRKGERQKVSKE
jgi:cob(I)alamin adenosyltransferase